MEFKQLKAFEAAARHLNFSKAAEELYLTQPSISKMVKALEEELEAILFERSPSLQLTDVGIELYNRSLQIIGLAESIPEEITKFRDTHVGEIKIGIPPIVGASFFPKLIGEFRKLYPGITIKLVESGSKSIINQLDEGKLDIGIVCSYPARIDEYLIKEFISSPLMAVINNQNPISKAESLTYEGLMDQNFILFQEDFSLYDIIISRCADAGYYPKLICNSSQRDFILEMVRANLGITLLPRIITDGISDASMTVISMKEPQVFLNLLMLWRAKAYKSKAMSEWIKFVGESTTKP